MRGPPGQARRHHATKRSRRAGDEIQLSHWLLRVEVPRKAGYNQLCANDRGRPEASCDDGHFLRFLRPASLPRLPSA